MKCPKCSYLGFETGERCRNCGYEFSLLAAPAAPPPDLPLTPPGGPYVEGPSLPLFAGGGLADDEPLIKLPVAPRPPLAVRRSTPARPRPRPVRKAPRAPAPKPRVRQPSAERLDRTPPLDFAPLEPLAPASVRAPDRAPAPVESPAGRRMAAALVDLAILFAIDAAVIYFTLRMAGLAMRDWRLVPLVPMLAFLGLVKLAYFCAFTAVGGQTIGKMAVGIQVVSEDERPLAPARAAWRVLAGAVSALAFGLGFIPALIGPDRRPLHDRLAHTRVVARRS